MGNYWGSIWSDMPPPKDVQPKEKTPILTSAEIFEYSILDELKSNPSFNARRKQINPDDNRSCDKSEQD